MKPGQELVLRFEKDKAYLSETKSLPIDSIIGLPEFVMAFPEPATWWLKVSSYDLSKGSVIVTMERCLKGKFDFPSEQSSDESIWQIGKIHLGILNRDCFVKSYYKDHEETEHERPANKRNGEKTYPNYPLYRPTVKSIYDSFSIPIKKITFIDGGVRFTRKIKGINEELDITILNGSIKKEFNAVKNYFASVLHTKRIFVEVHLEILEGKITKEDIRSQEIEQIDASTVEQVNAELVDGIINLRREVDSEKTLLTLEELMNTITGEDINSGIFYEEDQGLVDDVIKRVETKHQHHLGFLSRRHLHQLTKLRFVLKPFSYVFLLESRLHYHLIWETHNTEEATYIWHIDKNLNEVEQFIRRIEGIISTIKANRKSDYIKSTPEGFNRVIHDYSDPVAGFKKWKSEIEGHLALKT